MTPSLTAGTSRAARALRRGKEEDVVDERETTPVAPKKMKKEEEEEVPQEDDVAEGGSEGGEDVDVERESERQGRGEIREESREAIARLTEQFEEDDPMENLVMPLPSHKDRDFCWYSLKSEWNKTVHPKPLRNDPTHRKFHFHALTGYAKLPFSQGQLPAEEGTSTRVRHELIFEAIRSFSYQIRHLDHLEAGIRTYWKHFKPRTLRRMFKDQPEDVCQGYLDTISKIGKLAFEVEEIITQSLPTLTAKGPKESVSMSQKQAACLLAYAFFCGFLPRKNQHYNHFSFHRFHTQDDEIYVEKMKFILWYFKTVTDEMPTGTLTFCRQAWDFAKDEEEGFDKWEDALSEVVVTSEGRIEEMDGCLQVDFANEIIGGGVMDKGSVQEEIRFLCCPEMLVSLLLCNRMETNEAILIQGAQQYSAYKGYGYSLRHVPMQVNREETRDVFGRARSYLVAIDAHPFKENKEMQYQSRFITREIKKAYAGFMNNSPNATTPRPIATGNWGCGVFNGDKELKSLIQLIAASKAGRAMIYVTFSNDEFASNLSSITEMMRAHKMNNGELFQILTVYNQLKKRREGVFTFVRRHIAESLAAL